MSNHDPVVYTYVTLGLNKESVRRNSKHLYLPPSRIRSVLRHSPDPKGVFFPSGQPSYRRRRHVSDAHLVIVRYDNKVSESLVSFVPKILFSYTARLPSPISEY